MIKVLHLIINGFTHNIYYIITFISTDLINIKKIMKLINLIYKD